jgi:hypothetical protein
MAFLQNQKYREIYEAAKSGNEKAKMILQALRKNQPQADLDRLTEDYYNIQTNTQVEPENAILEENQPENIVPEEGSTIETTADVAEFDLTKILDDEIDGLLDELEIDDLSFDEFLKNKSRDSLRARKGSDYFKAYDSMGRNEYMNNKINSYKSNFDGRLKDIERRYNDVSQSMSAYSQNVNDMLDDGVEMDMDKVASAYNDFTTDAEAMGSFGRHWDENDNALIVAKLQGLVAQYGKQNVAAALNTISSDNDNYRDFLNNQIDSEVSRYTKSIENILK